MSGKFLFVEKAHIILSNRSPVNLPENGHLGNMCIILSMITSTGSKRERNSILQTTKEAVLRRQMVREVTSNRCSMNGAKAKSFKTSYLATVVSGGYKMFSVP